MATQDQRMYFDIADDLIVSIFNKIGDIDSLFSCYFSCHRFEHLVFHITSPVSIEIDGRPEIQAEPMLIIPIWPPGKLNFLSRFSFIQSVTIRFNHVNPQYIPIPGPLYRWRTDSVSFTMLHAHNCVHGNEEDATHICNMVPEADFMGQDYYEALALTEHPLADSVVRMQYIKQVLASLPNLTRILAVDCVKQGIVVLDEEGIAHLKEQLEDGQLEEDDEDEDDEDEGPLDTTRRIWSAMTVKLPFSKFEMRDVTVVSYRLNEAPDIAAESLLEEVEFSRVATTMMNEDAYDETPFPHPKFFFFDVLP